jgi:hypothetical protein
MHEIDRKISKRHRIGQAVRAAVFGMKRGNAEQAPAERKENQDIFQMPGHRTLLLRQPPEALDGQAEEFSPQFRADSGLEIGRLLPVSKGPRGFRDRSDRS